ncbi:uncharacterized protein I303_102698 [Kwoniella dejecticola CBS 10117]|uniref:Short-chain dehydrogenase/reductase SDR n=1 Tax=Kwoniella dejecticola CBS 10117 TaxID=1296121 RepID=A0A1A6A9H2_9TREE|nr:uncharacterized protein I303_02713 [Kwoniella dejecticola CBS 10117]OBR86701.1 hypothetical protein I303_02713 [Kwoniella dejecticola CBS 10117]
MLSGVALITGAGGCGIGSAISRAFAKSGATKLILTDINPKTLAQTVDAIKSASSSSSSSAAGAGGIPPEILALDGDISDTRFIDHLFDQVRSKFGRLDYAINNAGISGNNQPSDQSSISDFDKITNINYRALWYCSKKELEIMKTQEISSQAQTQTQMQAQGRGQRGSIVNIASQLGIVGRPDAPIYCASKSAVIGLTRCDAIDAAPYQIRVNAVCPGIIHTPMTDNSLRPALIEGKKDMQRPMDLTESVNIAPMRRMGTPEEVADVVVFLSSEKASFVQGASWVVDGGYTIN